MLLTIKKGRHQDTRPFSSWPHFGRKSMAWQVTFARDCEYQLPAYNREDVNKLFGLSFGLFAVHKNSARFGWRWNPGNERIELLAYCYIDGKRNWNERLAFPVVAQIRIGETVECRLGIHANGFYYFTVRDTDGKSLGMHLTDKLPDLPRYGLTHSLYFGGALPAPHDMHVTMSKL
ncbi:hypothetical protein LJY25_14870 [Hymenobacter sp. BT175]|uniref:hypothetical protein n=1 Tax=Hymenobacter translucens TaxID=2886507 RepID=UPI001D0DF931|nr:hypothetical protein [Hymenobacter translucens]MCC2547736.1 hypothetical protein [Hymenobacter translucens]